MLSQRLRDGRALRVEYLARGTAWRRRDGGYGDRGPAAVTPRIARSVCGSAACVCGACVALRDGAARLGDADVELAARALRRRWASCAVDGGRDARGTGAGSDERSRAHCRASSVMRWRSTGSLTDAPRRRRSVTIAAAARQHLEARIECAAAAGVTLTAIDGEPHAALRAHAARGDARTRAARNLCRDLDRRGRRVRLAHRR